METPFPAVSRALAFFTVVLFAALCGAQYSGNIQGIITDPTGAALAGASVRLRNLDTGIEQATATSSSGNYRFSSLQPGRYVITAQASGFEAKEVTLTLSTAELQGINLTLPVGSAKQSVTVTSEAPTLDTDETRLQATLPSQTVRDLPQLNRNIYDGFLSPRAWWAKARGSRENRPAAAPITSAPRRPGSAPTGAATPAIAFWWTAWT